MQCPWTNQGPFTFAYIIGANEQENPANQISVDLSLSTNHMRALSVTGDAETGFNTGYTTPTRTPIPRKALKFS